jgi:dipeptidyl aminopeptidase/acylaminoacyl peptidase
MLVLPRTAPLRRLPLLAPLRSVTAKRSAPCGTWPSLLPASAVAAGSVRVGGLWLDGADLYFTESRPAQQGRMTLLLKRGDAPACEILPAPFSVRSRVHEYGGGAFAVSQDLVVFANDADQRLYRLDVGAAMPAPLTAPGPIRYADLQFDRGQERVICVAERARDGNEPENFIASVSLATGAVEPLLRGADFYAFPRLDPAGERLAFLTWQHPAMPWDACELMLAGIRSDGSLDRPVKLAGGASEAIFQPVWSPAGELTFVSDRTGFFNLYRQNPDGHATCLCGMEADFAAPLWVFGLSTYGWLDEKTLACLYQSSGFWRLAILDPQSGRLEPVDTDLTELASIVAGQGHAVFVGGSAAQVSAIHRLDGKSREVTLLHRPAGIAFPQEAIAQPRAVDFPSPGGATAHALFYPPHNPAWASMPGESPPLLVTCHGGPTASASTALNLGIQYWTSRGFAVLDVNYRGSTGYGRAYRKMLDGAWGVADVEDCVAGAQGLAAQGLVDGARMAIRGSSAGGLTVLCALAFHDTFAAGASYYGVSDLVALAEDTHKFESRYLESLVGPYPARADLYRARSPIHAAARLSCPVIFFQGAEDRVVPPTQAEAMAAALRARGLAAPLLLFPGEQHGFRREETIRRALEAELDFYCDVFSIAGEED